MLPLSNLTRITRYSTATTKTYRRTSNVLRKFPYWFRLVRPFRASTTATGQYGICAGGLLPILSNNNNNIVIYAESLQEIGPLHALTINPTRTLSEDSGGFI